MRIAALALLAAGLVPHAFTTAQQAPPPQRSQERPGMNTQSYVGMWVTADGHIRHELLANGRYDEARGHRKSAYQGSYTLTGHHIEYVDDTGFTVDGDFVDGVLYHAGMVLYRER
jgi:hypothetical protein